MTTQLMSARYLADSIGTNDLEQAGGLTCDSDCRIELRAGGVEVIQGRGRYDIDMVRGH